MSEKKQSSKFNFSVYSPRWNRQDTYSLNVLKNGWHVAYISIGGDCNERGEPYLYENFKQDSIQYPSGLGFEMELLFEHARDKSLSDEVIQSRLNRLAHWVEEVNAVERPNFD